MDYSKSLRLNDRLEAISNKLAVSLAEQVMLDTVHVHSKVEDPSIQNATQCLVFMSVEVDAILQPYTRTLP